MACGGDVRTSAGGIVVGERLVIKSDKNVYVKCT